MSFILDMLRNHELECLVKKWACCVKVKVTGEVQNVIECLLILCFCDTDFSAT